MKTICAWCKKLLEGNETDAVISHGICLECAKKHYSEPVSYFHLAQLGLVPTPELVHLEIGNGRIVYENGHELCRMPASCVTGEWIEKANKIVRAVNSHEALLKIAKELKEAIKRGGDLQLGPKGRNATLEERLDKAIAQAEGRP